MTTILKGLPSQEAQRLRESRPAPALPEAPPPARSLSPAAAAEQRRFHAQAADDIQRLRTGLPLPLLPPVPAPPAPPTPATVEGALRADPKVWEAYQKLSPQQREALVNLGQATWSSGSGGRLLGGEPPPLPGLDPTLRQLLQEGRLTSQDSQGHTLLDNLDSLRQQKFGPGFEANQVLRQTLSSLGPSPAFFGPNPVPLGTQRPAEYVRLMAGLTSPQGQVRLENGATLRLPPVPEGLPGPPFAPMMLMQSLLNEAGQHRDALPAERRQEAVRTALQANAPAWEAFQKMSPEDQGRFLELADTPPARDAQYLTGALKLDAAVPLDVNLVGLLASGRLGDRDSRGQSLLENLVGLRNQAFDPSYNGQQVLGEALATLNRGPANPLGRPPAGPADTLAQRRPSEYIRVLAGLTSPEGSVKLPDGQTLRRAQPPQPGPLGGLAGLLGQFPGEGLGRSGAETVQASLRDYASTIPTAPGQEARRQAFRQQVQADPQLRQAYEALSPEQREQLERVADPPESARQSELLRALGLDAPAADPNLLRLLREGKLTRTDSTGQTLLQNLNTLATQDYPAPLEASTVLRDTLQDVADPYSIHQGDRGTCTVTSIQFLLAKNDPAEYARLVAGVTGRTGTVRMRGGEELARRPEFLAPDTSGRPTVSRIFQSSMMDFGDGALIYQNEGDGRHVTQLRLPDGTTLDFPRGGGGGLYDNEWNSVARQILGTASDVRVPQGGLLGQMMTQLDMARALAAGPVLVALRWPSPQYPNGGHMLVVERIENGRVYMRNPWGQGERGGDGRDGTPARELVPGGQPGQMSMTVEEFYRYLSAYAAPLGGA